MDGGDGDDTIRALSNIVVLGGNGNIPSMRGPHSQVDGGAGNDVISAWANSRVSGGEAMFGSPQRATASSTVAPATTRLQLLTALSSLAAPEMTRSYDEHGSTVLFSAGDGKDTIYAGGDTTLRLGEGLTADKMQVEVSGSTATISFGDGSDQITLHLGHRLPRDRGVCRRNDDRDQRHRPMIRLTGAPEVRRLA